MAVTVDGDLAELRNKLDVILARWPGFDVKMQREVVQQLVRWMQGFVFRYGDDPDIDKQYVIITNAGTYHLSVAPTVANGIVSFYYKGKRVKILENGIVIESPA